MTDRHIDHTPFSAKVKLGELCGVGSRGQQEPVKALNASGHKYVDACCYDNPSIPLHHCESLSFSSSSISSSSFCSSSSSSFIFDAPLLFLLLCIHLSFSLSLSSVSLSLLHFTLHLPLHHILLILLSLSCSLIIKEVWRQDHE